MHTVFSPISNKYLPSVPHSNRRRALKSGGLFFYRIYKFSFQCKNLNISIATDYQVVKRINSESGRTVQLTRPLCANII